MTSHPEAAGRKLADVVTQLPDPARLGLLRFERLNEASWKLLYLDPACQARLGLPASQLCDLLEAPYASLMQPAQRLQLHQQIQQQLQQHGHYRVQYRLHSPLGPLQLCELGQPLPGPGRQRLQGYLICQDDLTLPNPQHAALLAGLQQSACAILLVSPEGRLDYVNASFSQITQYSTDEVLGRSITELAAMENLAERLFDSHSGLASHNSWQGEFKSRRKNHEPYWGRLNISKVFDAQGQLSHYLGIYQDITDEKLQQQRVEKLAYTDTLTGLGNRAFFINRLDQHFQRQAPGNGCLLLVDIDNFKRINDSLGHQSGDKLLASLARRLRNSLPNQTPLARFASNEFALLLEDCSLHSGQQQARQLLETLGKPLFVDNQLISISGSIGLAQAPLHGSNTPTLLKHAGLALHKAKANGKQQLQVFSETLNAEAQDKLFLDNNLRLALERNELRLHYQPKLCLHSGRLLGLEALLRWQHPQRGMISPDSFIAVAEESGLIIPIGKWVMRTACRMARQLADAGLGRLHMAINLSSRQFADPELCRSLSDILAEEGLPGSQLELELTESLLLEASEATRQQLHQLKQLGVQLAMDDFGTGYSSLGYLKKFPIDVIKIDRSFVRDVPHCEDDMEIIAAVIAMAHKLRLQVVAEGIEDRQQLAFLRRQQCDIGQGYLFDRPLPADELLQRLSRYQRPV